MRKIASIALMIGGTALVILGISASNSISSEVSQLLTGTPTDKSVWMLVSGCVILGVGLTLMVREGKQA